MSYRVKMNNYVRIALVLTVSVLSVGCDSYKDSTDPTNGISGMSLRVDNLTGCQYLHVSGYLLPRVDKRGDHICYYTEKWQILEGSSYD